MSELASSDLVLRQVEYYMSDSNYPFDTYLQSLAREADGCVPLASLVEFPRLKKLVEGDVEKLRDALAATDSLAFSESRDGVKRLYPTPDADPACARSVHVTGFPKGSGEETMKGALAKYGAVASVRALRNLNQDTRQLDGSAIVAYEGEEGAAAAAGAGTGGMVAHAGSMLTIKVCRARLLLPILLMILILLIILLILNILLLLLILILILTRLHPDRFVLAR